MSTTLSQQDVRSEVAKELHSGRKWLLASGILALIAGAVAIIVPAAASVTMALFIGWLLIFGGVLLLFDAFSAPSAGRVIMRVVFALITGGIGVYLLVAPLKGTVTLTAVLAFWFIVVGLLRLVVAIQEHGMPGSVLVGLNGALSLILGVLIATNLPASANWAIGLLVGIEFIFYGFAAIMLASAAKQAEKEALGGAGSTPATA
ncbi:MAG: HdeD family acid-resistance protein [Actinomycetota bacterium]